MKDDLANHEMAWTRREILNLGVSAAAAVALVPGDAIAQEPVAAPRRLVDTNVNLFQWPFRRVPLDETDVLVKKLRSLGVAQAWAGSFESLLHRDVAGVNRRLVEVCQSYAELLPVGTVNLTLPDWEEDLRWCLEQTEMPAVRLHPNYHGYGLDDPRFAKLLEQTAAAGRLVQLTVAMEDARTQHPRVRVAEVDLRPLAHLVAKISVARVQLLNYRPAGVVLEQLAAIPGIYFDTSRVESTDGVAQLVRRVGAERVLFGTHAPFLIPESALIRLYESGSVDEPVLRAIESGNAERFARSSQKASPPASVGDARRVAAQPADRKSTSLGLPDTRPLREYRIWDSYFTPSHGHPGEDGSSRLFADVERSLPAIEKAGFEKLCYFPHVGIGTTTDRRFEQLVRERPDLVLRPLQRWPELLIGMIQMNVNDVRASLDAIDRWLGDGPMKGVYFASGGPGSQCCTHPNMYPLVERIAKLGGVIIQHTWFKTGGKDGPGESTPAELAELAARYPDQKFVCAHAGGEWQLGIRAVRESPNILVETSGFDATAGFIEMAVRELGASRIIFGSHLPSRSLGTELGKVLGAQITDDEKRLILGANYRQLLREKTI